MVKPTDAQVTAAAMAYATAVDAATRGRRLPTIPEQIIAMRAALTAALNLRG